MEEPILLVDRVVKRFGGVTAVNGVSLSLEAGRIYGCANTSFGGYPFRIEVTCTEPAVDDRGTGQSIRARNIAAVAQVWDPTLVIGEIAGPMTVAPLGGSPTAIIDWTLAQGSLRGMPGARGDRLRHWS